MCSLNWTNLNCFYQKQIRGFLSVINLLTFDNISSCIIVVSGESLLVPSYVKQNDLIIWGTKNDFSSVTCSVYNDLYSELGHRASYVVSYEIILRRLHLNLWYKIFYRLIRRQNAFVKVCYFTCFKRFHENFLSQILLVCITKVR